MLKAIGCMYMKPGDSILWAGLLCCVCCGVMHTKQCAVQPCGFRQLTSLTLLPCRSSYSGKHISKQAPAAAL